MFQLFGRKAQDATVRAGKTAKNKAGKSGQIPTNAGDARRALLKLRPIRNPALNWDEDEGVVVLHIALEESSNSRSWKAKVAGFFVQLPEKRSVELDAIGSDVWMLLDGKNTVGEIVKILAKKHQLTSRETELSLQQYFKELNRRGYIAFTGE
ncbi:MAG TPA: PqqD family protein [Abditibacteriaceae bacterium]|jgi:queuine/archaeosine tRNA-ribosyltransferase